MKNKFKKFLLKYKSFTILDWATFTIGIMLILLYLSIILWNWWDKSYLTWKTYYDNPEIIAKINEIASAYEDDEQRNIVYKALLPNATLLLWGETTYWFTFMSNIYMSITIVLFPFFKQSKKAQNFYFAGIIYIIIVVLVFWFGWISDPNIGGTFTQNDFYRTIIWHGIAPFLGILTIFWERKRIKISTGRIWSFSIFPSCYLIFILFIYFFGYKFKNLNAVEFFPSYTNSSNNPIPIQFNREIDRGITIYSAISFWEPLGYKGDNTYLKSVLIVFIILSAFFAAPIIGFLLRKILRILQPGQRKLQKIYFIKRRK
ncbi:hypothetical protein RRG54_04140 [Mycoplasmopsis felis]|uniref:MAGa3780 family membrane protein n=1 Tax=Mycoplasmopsis felis TaxID=33923 RepID=UPI002AFE4BDD|nr:hypothetical protein [Mycoplasmopsis felis]WQQ11332.1 hypothetical protein RRG50_02685 [Mycoplasmopsis felis]